MRSAPVTCADVEDCRAISPSSRAMARQSAGVVLSDLVRRERCVEFGVTPQREGACRAEEVVDARACAVGECFVELRRNSIASVMSMSSSRLCGASRLLWDIAGDGLGIFDGAVGEDVVMAGTATGVRILLLRFGPSGWRRSRPRYRAG